MQVGGKRRILVVENESIIAKEISMSLERLGYEVAGVVSNYKDAIEKSYEKPIDLALMDINIDGSKDGIQTAMALRQHFNIPVIFLTSLIEMETIQKAKTSEPFGYLIKPLRKDELQSTIEIALFNFQKTKNLTDDVEKLSSAMGVIETAIIITDPDGVIDYYNKKVEILSGFIKKSKNGTSINNFLIIEGKPAWNYLCEFNEKERLQNSFEFLKDSYLINNTGEKIAINGNISSFHTHEGKIAGYIIVLGNNHSQAAEQHEDVKEQISGQILNNYFFLKDKSSLYRIHIDDITHVEALGNYVKVHTAKKIYTVLFPLKDIEKMLSAEKFFRIHRSFIVGLNHITAIHNLEAHVPNAVIPIGKTFKDDLLKKIQVL